MRLHSFQAAVVLLCSCAIPLAAQTEQKQPKKGDAVIVRGCLRGSAVEEADLLTEDKEGEVATMEGQAVPSDQAAAPPESAPAS